MKPSLKPILFVLLLVSLVTGALGCGPSHGRPRQTAHNGQDSVEYRPRWYSGPYDLHGRQTNPHWYRGNWGWYTHR
jgi:hypothetical protein